MRAGGARCAAGISVLRYSGGRYGIGGGCAMMPDDETTPTDGPGKRCVVSSAFLPVPRYAALCIMQFQLRQVVYGCVCAPESVPINSDTRIHAHQRKKTFNTLQKANINHFAPNATSTPAREQRNQMYTSSALHKRPRALRCLTILSLHKSALELARQTYGAGSVVAAFCACA